MGKSYIHMTMRCACIALAPLLLQAAPAADPTLDEMKAAFTSLMRDRAALAARARTSLQVIREARRTAGPDTGVRAPTAQAYRAAVRQVERALDNHPDVKRLEAQYDKLQAEKLAVAGEQAGLVDAWYDAKTEGSRQLSTAIERASAKADAEQRALLERAGQTHVSKLSVADRREMVEIHARLTNQITFAKAAFAQTSSPAAVVKAREEDGSDGKFRELNEQYKELADAQTRLKGEIAQLRKTLRENDPAIVKLLEAAREASHVHTAAAGAAPEVVEARDFIQRVSEIRSVIDDRAGTLRQDILGKDPDYGVELDRQARAAGMPLAETPSVGTR